MKRLLKWLVIIVGGVLLAVVIAAAVLTIIGSSRLSGHYDVDPQPLTVSANEQDIARFKNLDSQLGCTFCHGPDLGGGLVDADLQIYAPNLTTGVGGVGATDFSDKDLVRAIHHGVDPQGRALLLMPADQFTNLSEADLAAALAFVRSFPPVNNEVPKSNPSLIFRVFMGLGLIPEGIIVPAREIDHNAPYRPYVEPGETAEYGQYLTSIAYCTHCHRSDFQGGEFPFPDPEAPVVPNISGNGEVGTWTVDQFRNTLRTGVTPAGRPLNPEYMDWPTVGLMSDEELGAIYLYLQSLSSVEAKGN